MSAAAAGSHRPQGRAQSEAVSARLRDASQRQIDDFQRARILAAMAEIASEEGAEHASVTKVVARVRLSRRTFYDVFADRDECLLAVIDDALARASSVVRPAYRGDGAWADRVRSALFELLILLDREPDLARLCLARLHADDAAMRLRRARLVALLSAALDQGRGQSAPAPLHPPPLAAEGAVCAIASIIYSRLLERPSSPLTDMLGAFMSLLVLPYLGQGQALRELSHPPPPPAARPPVRRAPPRITVPEQSQMRVTYRTSLVLKAIAAKPDVSNSGVAAAAGIKDPAQVSRLLARLERLGLIENARHGNANAWRLTPEGETLTGAIALDRKDTPAA